MGYEEAKAACEWPGGRLYEPHDKADDAKVTSYLQVGNHTFY